MDIEFNQFRYALPLLQLEQLTELDISDNRIHDVPEYIINQYDCLKDLQLFQEEIKDIENQEVNTLVKLQLLGNGGAGKTSILEALQKGKCDIVFASTHGVIVDTLGYSFEDKKVDFQVWDFGGQELFFGTHRLFLNSEALQLLVVDVETALKAGKGEQDRDRIKEEEKVWHQPLEYYMALTKVLNKHSPQLVCLNKIDKDRDAEEIAIEKKIFQAAAQEGLTVYKASARTGKGIPILKSALAELREEILHYGRILPKSWLRVQRRILEKVNDPDDKDKLMTQTQFDALCRELQVNEKAIPSVLKFLHSIGVVYSNTEFLEDKIIIDQQWALDAIYKPLDRESPFYDLLRNQLKGKVWAKLIFYEFGNSYTLNQKKLFLQFMKSCGLCFPLLEENQKETEETYYVFPEFLPEEKPEAVEAIWTKITDVQTFSCSIDYIDYYGIQKFIVELGRKTQLEHIWKNGIYVDSPQGKFKVEHREKTIQVGIESRAVPYMLWPVVEAFGESLIDAKQASWMDEAGNTLDTNTLREQHRTAPEAKEKHIKPDTKTADLERKSSSNEDLQLADQIPDVIQQSPRRIVVSFAREDFKLVEELKKNFIPFEDKGVQLIYDDIHKTYNEGYNPQILQLFNDAHAFIILVSLDYQNKGKKEYIWEHEFPIMKRKRDEEGANVFCIKVDPGGLNNDLEPFNFFDGGHKCLLKLKGYKRIAYFTKLIEVIMDKELKKQ